MQSWPRDRPVFEFTRWDDRPEAVEPQPYFGADCDVYGFDGDLKHARIAEKPPGIDGTVPGANFA